MSSLSSRAFGRRQVAVLVVASLALVGFVTFRARQASAHETYVDQAMTCTIGGNITAHYTINHEPETLTPGVEFTIDTKSTVDLDPSAPDVPIKAMKIIIPNPADVVSAGDIMVMGGNLKKASQTSEGANTILNMTANAGVTSKTIQVPELMIPVTVGPAAAGKVINFYGPNTLELTILIGTVEAPVTCTGAATNPPILAIKAQSPATTTTTAAPTTTTKAPTTTTTMAPTTTTKAPTTTTTMAPTTTTTKAPTTTTTKAPTTTTTKAPTTTTTKAPTTTTTKAPTTTTTAGPTTTKAPTTTTTRMTPTTMKPGGGLGALFALLKRIICILFKIGC
jgi:hypothetical protein